MAEYQVGDHNRDLLYGLYEIYGQRGWNKITKEYNEAMPGRDDNGVTRPWTKEELQKKRNNYKDHGQWKPTKMKAPHNSQVLEAQGQETGKTTI